MSYVVQIRHPCTTYGMPGLFSIVCRMLPIESYYSHTCNYFAIRLLVGIILLCLAAYFNVHRFGVAGYTRDGRLYSEAGSIPASLR